jgi:hypothetical protein
MTAELLLLLITGGLVGFWVGRWWAEAGRGRHDARRAWRGRKDWRGK